MWARGAYGQTSHGHLAQPVRLAYKSHDRRKRKEYVGIQNRRRWNSTDDHSSIMAFQTTNYNCFRASGQAPRLYPVIRSLDHVPIDQGLSAEGCTPTLVLVLL